MERANSDQSETAAQAAELYDAVGDLYWRCYGQHVHVGLYDDMRSKSRPAWGAAQHTMVERLLALSGLASATRLLDIGCGHGATALHWAEALGCEAVGINISPFQVERANRLAAERGLAGRASFAVADGMAPPFGDGHFDVVLSVESAAYMPDKSAFIAQIARLLAPGGRVVLADFCRAPGALTKRQERRLAAIDGAFASAGNWHSAEQYKELMEANGLAVVAEDDWTGRLRGFWDLGMAELLLRRGPEEEAAYRARGGAKNAALLARKFFEMSALIHKANLAGNFEPFKMAFVGLTLGRNKRVMRGAFGSGALRYRVVVAEKPTAAAAAAGAAAAGAKVPPPPVIRVTAGPSFGSDGCPASDSDSGRASSSGSGSGSPAAGAGAGGARASWGSGSDGDFESASEGSA